MQKFKILTKKSILDIREEISDLSSDSQDDIIHDFYEKQQIEFLNNEYYAIHFLEDKHFINESYVITFNIYETIEYLAIKDGFDIVQFENGKKGIIAYYNGHIGGLEFIEISENQYYNFYEDISHDKIKDLFNQNEEIKPKTLKEKLIDIMIFGEHENEIENKSCLELIDYIINGYCETDILFCYDVTIKELTDLYNNHYIQINSHYMSKKELIQQFTNDYNYYLTSPRE